MMNAATAIQLALALLQGILNATGQGKAVPPEVIPAVEGAIDKLLSIHNTEVTLGQLEDLRLHIS